MSDLVITTFAVVAGVGALIAAIVALPKALVIVGHTIRAIFRWAVAAVRAVALISELGERLGKIDRKIDTNAAKLDQHIENTRVGVVAWEEMRGGLATLLHKQEAVLQVAEDVRYEVKNNGGGSMRDTTDRIEAGVKGLYAKPGETGGPGRENES